MTALELLELDIDCRMALLWGEVNDVQEWTPGMVGAFLRAAYGKGYQDALSEPVRGSLCREHGYRVPERKCS